MDEPNDENLDDNRNKSETDPVVGTHCLLLFLISFQYFSVTFVICINSFDIDTLYIYSAEKKIARKLSAK